VYQRHIFSDVQLNKMKDYYEAISRPNKMKKIPIEENFKVIACFEFKKLNGKDFSTESRKMFQVQTF
jgi:hypothetical protein